MKRGLLLNAMALLLFFGYSRSEKNLVNLEDETEGDEGVDEEHLERGGGAASADSVNKMGR